MAQTVKTPMAIAFAKIRKDFSLSKADLLRLLQQQDGLTRLNWGTYRNWSAGVLPKPAYELALRGALQNIRTSLEAKDGKRR